MDTLIRNAEPRPPRGKYRLEQRGKKRERKLAEDRVMQAARKRDGNKCQFPRCEFKDLAVEVAHLEHRKMGGNPSGEATQRHKLICLCIRRHDQFDGRTIPEIDIQPVNAAQGTDGPCVFHIRDKAGIWRYVGISEARR